MKFSSEGFFNIILPPMIFQAGYNIRGHRILQNFLFILLYGVLGTLVSTLLFVFGIYYLNRAVIHDIIGGKGLTVCEIFYLATLLSNWETHTCILILDEKKHPTLTSHMFGETMVNDAVIIALFNSVHNMETSLKTQTELGIDYVTVIQELLLVGSASVGVGIAFGLAISAVLRLVRGLIADNPYLQMSFILVAGYMSFMVSEKLHLAGALSIFCAGFTMAHYGAYSLTERGRTLTKVTVHFLGFLPESFVYAYLGIFVPVCIPNTTAKLLCLSAVILGSLLVRAGSVLSVFAIGSALTRRISLERFKTALVMTAAGLIRGSIPFALSMTLSHDEEDKERVRFIQQLLLVTIFVTTPTLGSMVRLWMVCLGVRSERGYEVSVVKKGEEYGSFIHGDTIANEVRIKGESGGCQRCWKKLDERLFRPIFGEKVAPQAEVKNETVCITLLRSSAGRSLLEQKKQPEEAKMEPRAV